VSKDTELGNVVLDFLQIHQEKQQTVRAREKANLQKHKQLVLMHMHEVLNGLLLSTPAVIWKTLPSTLSYAPVCCTAAALARSCK
jgi:hypothetical protein